MPKIEPVIPARIEYGASLVKSGMINKVKGLLTHYISHRCQV